MVTADLTAKQGTTGMGKARMPSRRVIRAWLAPLAGRRTLYALALVGIDIGCFAACLAGSVVASALALKLLWGAAAGFFIGRLFILGHDACHQSFTDHRGLNRWIGRLCFVPSLTPYSLWEVGHNVVHHGYTNLRGVDFIWAPLTREEYEALPRWRRALERAYRSGWAPGLYYLLEVWWRHLFFPRASSISARRPAFLGDCLLVSAAGVLWLSGLWLAARGTGQSFPLLLFTSFLVPFACWGTMIGFVVYVHHTHPSVAWYEDKVSWGRAQAFVSTTVHLTFRPPAGALLHHIMEHTAHHVDMGVPLYRLKQAQRILEERLPGRIVVQPFSWHWYFATAARCKLYDYKTQRWTDFSGRATSLPAPSSA